MDYLMKCWLGACPVIEKGSPQMFIKSNPQQTVKIFLISFISILSLFLGFFTNYWQVAEPQWFNNFQHDSESYIIGRLVKSDQDGILSNGGLIGLGSIENIPFSNHSQYLAYSDGLSFVSYKTYYSQIGAQGMLFSALDRLVGFSPQERLIIFYGITSLLSAVAITAIILWFYSEFGMTVALFVFASAFFSQWLVVFGRNLFWSLWAFFLPVIAIMYYLKTRRELTDIQPFKFGTVIFGAIFVKCLFNGYEYITTTLIMMTVPFVYYGILKSLSFRRFLTGLFTAVFSSFLAIFLSFIILCTQIASIKGGFLDGVDHILFSFEKRTYANPQDFPSLFAPSLESDVGHVVFAYLKGTFFDFNNYLHSPDPFISKYILKIRYFHLILLFMIMSGILYSLQKKHASEKEGRSQLALIFATWFSILAPLSWFVIFKAHSYAHTHLNYIVWQMPFVFFGFAVCGLVVKSFLPDFARLARHFIHIEPISKISP
jgi:hypothetical protein